MVSIGLCSSSRTQRHVPRFSARLLGDPNHRAKWLNHRQLRNRVVQVVARGSAIRCFAIACFCVACLSSTSWHLLVDQSQEHYQLSMQRAARRDQLASGDDLCREQRRRSVAEGVAPVSTRRSRDP